MGQEFGESKTLLFNYDNTRQPSEQVFTEKGEQFTAEKSQEEILSDYQLELRLREIPEAEVNIVHSLTKSVKKRLEPKKRKADNVVNTLKIEKFNFAYQKKEDSYSFTSGNLLKIRNVDWEEKTTKYDFQTFQNEQLSHVIGIDIKGDDLFSFTNKRHFYQTKISEIDIPENKILLNRKGFMMALQNFSKRKFKRIMMYSHQCINFSISSEMISVTQIQVLVQACLVNDYIPFHVNDEITFKMELVQ